MCSVVLCRSYCVAMFKQLHHNMKAGVNVNWLLSDPIPVDNRVKQGDIPAHRHSVVHSLVHWKLQISVRKLKHKWRDYQRVKVLTTLMEEEKFMSPRQGEGKENQAKGQISWRCLLQVWKFWTFWTRP